MHFPYGPPPSAYAFPVWAASPTHAAPSLSREAACRHIEAIAGTPDVCVSLEAEIVDWDSVGTVTIGRLHASLPLHLRDILEAAATHAGPRAGAAPKAATPALRRHKKYEAHRWTIALDSLCPWVRVDATRALEASLPLLVHVRTALHREYAMLVAVSVAVVGAGGRVAHTGGLAPPVAWRVASLRVEADVFPRPLHIACRVSARGVHLEVAPAPLFAAAPSLKALARSLRSAGVAGKREPPHTSGGGGGARKPKPPLQFRWRLDGVRVTVLDDFGMAAPAGAAFVEAGGECAGAAFVEVGGECAGEASRDAAGCRVLAFEVSAIVREGGEAGGESAGVVVLPGLRVAVTGSELALSTERADGAAPQIRVRAAIIAPLVARLRAVARLRRRAAGGDSDSSGGGVGATRKTAKPTARGAGVSKLSVRVPRLLVGLTTPATRGCSVEVRRRCARND